MPFTAPNFQNDPSTATPVNAANLNTLGGQYEAVAADISPGQTNVADAMNLRVGVDTGWSTVPIAAGYSGGVSIRKIGPIVYIRGNVTRTAGNFPTNANYNDILTISGSISGPATHRRLVAMTGGAAALFSMFSSGANIVYVPTGVVADTIYFDNVMWFA